MGLGVADVGTHDFPFTMGVVGVRDREKVREGEMRPTDMACKSCVLGCWGYRSWEGGGVTERRTGRGRGRD